MKRVMMVSAAVLALAGCQREGPTDANAVNIVADNAYENMTVEGALPLENVANAANVVEAPAPPPSIEELEQTQEDADATGMTSRTDRQAQADQDGNGDGDGVPVEEK